MGVWGSHPYAFQVRLLIQVEWSEVKASKPTIGSRLIVFGRGGPFKARITEGEKIERKKETLGATSLKGWGRCVKSARNRDGGPDYFSFPVAPIRKNKGFWERKSKKK